MNNMTSSIQSLDRVISIIELLSLYPKGVTLTELCSKTQLPKGTVSRMLSALLVHGYVMQNIENKHYCLTMRLFEIGCRVVGGANILSIARPYLENLSTVTQDTVHLVSRDNDEVVYLYKEDVTSSIVRMSSCVGSRNPMYCTGVGKSILAYIPEEEVAAIWNRTEIIQHTPNTITTLDRLLDELAEVRRSGFAIDDVEHEIGVRCIAAPILDFHNVPIAAISISAHSDSLTDQKIREYSPLLIETAKNISRYYGA